MRKWIMLATAVFLMPIASSFGESDGVFSLENIELREWLLSEQIQAWLMCYRDLISIEELSNDERNLNSYDTEFYRDRDYWVIRFRRTATHDDSGSHHIQGITYWVEKISMRIYRRIYEH